MVTEYDYRSGGWGFISPKVLLDESFQVNIGLMSSRGIHEDIQSYAKVWAPLIISITFIYKMLGVWMRNVFVIYIHIRHGQ